MLLQSLVNYYYDLAEQEKVFPRGWEHVNISYVLDLDENGRLKEVASVKQQQTTGKKSFMRPTAMLLPTAVLRSNGVHPNFLWDKSSYILGVDDKGKPTRTAECFSASKAWHKKLLDGVDLRRHDSDPFPEISQHDRMHVRVHKSGDHAIPDQVCHGSFRVREDQPFGRSR